MTDKEYLEKPLVPGLSFELSKYRIRIVSDSTIFVSVNKIDRLIQEDVLALYKSILGMCKQYGIKILYKNSFKKHLLVLWGDYTREVDEYNAMFEELRKKAEKVEKRGIHYGCSDDIVLKEMTDYANSMNPYLYRTSAISKVNEIYRELYQLKLRIKDVYETERTGYSTALISKVYL